MAAYQESVELLERIADQPAAATCAFTLGTAHKDLPALRDLDQAEHWYRRSLELRATGDRLGQARCHGQLGCLAYERFKETRSPTHLSSALEEYRTALDLLPSSAVNDLAVTHNQLGNIYRATGDLNRALHHWRESIRYEESAGNLYGAAVSKRNLAATLARVGRFEDALAYAQAALRNYETYGDRAQADLQKTYQLIAKIQAAMRSQLPGNLPPA